MPQSKRSRIPSERALVQQLASIIAPDDPPDFWDALEDPQGSTLWEKLRHKLVVADGGKPIDFDTEGDDYDRISAALPTDLKKALVKFSDRRDEEQNVTMIAAYRVGVAVGRRLGGAR
jgi:hypothetical protein